jgi:hypothetical protein
MNRTSTKAIPIRPNERECELAIAITKGFLVMRRTDRVLEREFRRHCEQACLPFIEVTLRRDRAYFWYDTDPTYRFSCGDVRLALEEMDQVAALLRDALTPRGICGGGNGHLCGGPFMPGKLLKACDQIARFAQAASDRFCAEHPDAGEQSWCTHLN